MGLAARPGAKHWLILLLSAVVLPVVVLLAVLAFAWPAARVAPRDLPLGIVGSSPASERTVLALQQADPGAFQITLYGTDAAARTAIEHREVYGALELSPGTAAVPGTAAAPGTAATPGTVTALTASAAGPTVAQLIVQVGDTVAQQSTAHGTPMKAATVDVVPSSAQDPRGLVLSSALLPLTICGVIIGAAIAIVIGMRPAWRQLLSLSVVSIVGAFAAYLIAQGVLGALPGMHLATLGVFALMLFATSSTVAGLIALFGPPGLGLGAALLVFVGNPFSGVTSAPELLPKPVGEIGRLLPPGAGAELLRSTAYFSGHGPTLCLTVLTGWALFGLGAVVAGHHSFIGFAARQVRRAAAHRAALDAG